MIRRFTLSALLALALPAFALTPPMATFVVSSGVGYRVNPMGGGEWEFHRGLDMVGPHGCSILAAGDGVVVEHWPAPGTVGRHGEVYHGHPVYGGMIVIDHGNGLFTLYAHMSRTFVYEGEHVRAGEAIGIQGRTGDATGEHLHWEIIVDPRVILGIPIFNLSDRQRKELLK